MSTGIVRINAFLLIASMIGGVLAVFLGLLSDADLGIGPIAGAAVFFVFSLICFASISPEEYKRVSIRNSPLPMPGNRANNIFFSGLSFLSLALGVIGGALVFEPESLMKGAMISLPGIGTLSGMFVGRLLRRFN